MTRIGAGAATSIYDAAMAFKAQGTPLVVFGGKEYGTGSSRDWAAKGTMLLGIKAVIAESFERIHRSNLIGMGVLPCQFTNGQNAQSLGLTGREVFDFGDLKNAEARNVPVTATGRSALRRMTAPTSRNVHQPRWDSAKVSPMMVLASHSSPEAIMDRTRLKGTSCTSR